MRESMDILIIVFFTAIVFSIFLGVLKIVHSHWNTLLDNFKYSTKEFYKLFKEELKNTKINGVSFNSVFLHEGAILISAKRNYLRITWKEFQFDLCAAPFGRGMFFSWWLLYKNGFLKLLLYRIPFIGRFLVRHLFPITYYKIDTATMFMRYVHLATLNTIDHVSNESGTRMLPEDERKPILNDIFKR